MDYKNLVKLIKKEKERECKDELDFMFFNISNNFGNANTAKPTEIEKLFCASFMFLTDISNINDAPLRAEEGNGLSSFRIEREVKIGQYRCDFLCEYEISCKNKIRKSSVIVECDSQKWHETSESHRRYEKKRERFIQSKGFNVLRFTGRELIEDPLICAKEVKCFLLNNINLGMA